MLDEACLPLCISSDTSDFYTDSYSLSRGGMILQDLTVQNPALTVRAETRHAILFSWTFLTLSLFPFLWRRWLFYVCVYIYIYILHSAYLYLSADSVSKKNTKLLYFPCGISSKFKGQHTVFSKGVILMYISQGNLSKWGNRSFK